MSDLGPIEPVRSDNPRLLRWLGRSAFVVSLVAGSLLTGEALALGLGSMTVRSRLGANFDAEVALLVSPEESRQVSECFRLAPPSDVGAGLPALTRGTVVVERKNGQPVLLIRSSQPINEPALVINLHAGCGAEVVREYTVLLDAPSTAVDKPEAASPSGRTIRTARPVGAEETKPDAVREGASATDADSYPAQWNVAAGDSGLSITRQLFPRQPKAQRRFLLALRQANPDLDFGDAGDVPLVAGQILRIPDTRRSRSGRDSTRPAPLPVRDEVKPVPPKAAEVQRENVESTVLAASRADGMTDRLSLSPSLPDGDVEVDEWSLRLSNELSFDKLNTTTESQRAVLRLEYKLLASIYDQANQQLALAEQVRQLEASVAELRAVTEKSLAVMPSPSASSVLPQTATATPEAAASVKSIPRAGEPVRQKAMASDASTGSAWYWLAGALLLVLLLTFFLRRRTSRARQQEIAVFSDEVDAPPALPDSGNESLVFASNPVTLPPHKVEPSPLSFPDDGGAAPETIASEQSVLPATAVVEHYEFDSVMELAEIMLAFGRVKGATEALEEYIETHPTGAVQPWMKLIDIYWQNSMRSEYEALAPKFAAHFNVQPVDWQAIPDVLPAPALAGNEADASIDELIARTPNIAALPAVREAIARHWVIADLPEAHSYLNGLLHDRNNPLYVGFSLSMVNEIVFLLAAIETRLESAAARNA